MENLTIIFFVLLFIVAVVLLPDLYVWGVFLRGKRWLWTALYLFPTLIFCLLPIVARTNLLWQSDALRLGVVLLMVLMVLNFLFALCSATGKAMAHFFPTAFLIGNGIGIAVCLAVAVMAGYALTRGWNRLIVKPVYITSERIPQSFDDYTIVQLSDFHIGTYRTAPKQVERIVEKVNGFHPDLIVFTGDLINVLPNELTDFQSLLSRLTATDGVYSVLGNHDYCQYGSPTPEQDLSRLVEMEQSMGWTVLRNRHCLLRRDNDSIALIGVENGGVPPFPSYADLQQATSGLTDSTYQILLSHDPSYWRRCVLPETGIQLTLSGHTHAGQLRIGNFSPAQWMYPEWAGLYKEDDRHLFVSTGIGGTIPFCLGAWHEICVIRLYAK